MTWAHTIDGGLVNLELVQALTYNPAGFKHREMRVYELVAHTVTDRKVLALRVGLDATRAELERIASAGARGGEAGVVRVKTPDALVTTWEAAADPF